MSGDLGKIGTLTFNKQRCPDFAFKAENPDLSAETDQFAAARKEKNPRDPIGFHKNSFTFLKKCIKYAT